MPRDTARPEQPQEPIVIRLNRANMLLMALISFAMALAGCWLLVISDPAGRAYSSGLLALLCGIPLLGVSLFRLFAPWPLLTIDGHGMHSRPLFQRPHTIMWEEIHMIHRYRSRYSQSFVVSLSPAGGKTYIARNFKNGRIPFSLLQDQSPWVISIPLLLSAMPYDKITELLHKHYGKQIRSNRIQIETKSPF